VDLFPPTGHIRTKNHQTAVRILLETRCDAGRVAALKLTDGFESDLPGGRIVEACAARPYDSPDELVRCVVEGNTASGRSVLVL
jgi:hypothetical protein